MNLERKKWQLRRKLSTIHIQSVEGFKSRKRRFAQKITGIFRGLQETIS